jgi:DNA-binding transcriptional LysR family regulator
MLDELDALRALRDTGTTGRAAVRLRITQSAVSKRIKALEERVGRPLVEPAGRRLRLTPAAEVLLAEADPLLQRLGEVLAGGVDGVRTLRVAASHSLLASWLPAALHAALARTPGVDLDLRVHRGPAVLEWLRAGDLDLAVCAEGDPDPSLAIVPLGDEPMVIVPSGLVPFVREGVVPVITIEPHSLTWSVLAGRIRARSPRWGWTVAPVRTIESFPAVVQLARAGFGHGLVPLPLALAAGVPAEVCVPFPGRGLHRTIVVVARPRTLDRPAVGAFVDALRAEVARRSL